MNNPDAALEEMRRAIDDLGASGVQVYSNAAGKPLDGPEFKVLGKNPLGEMTLASPAVAGGGLFIRTASNLYRIAR